MVTAIKRFAQVACVLAAAVAMLAPGIADEAFQRWLAELRLDAEKIGVSRQTFETATRDLEPDLSLPDLDLPGRKEPRGQAEFVRSPADYLNEATLARLVAEGRKLMAAHRATLAAIEQRFGVPPTVVLAIWGRETAFGGGHGLPHNAIRVLATQAYVGRRKEQFRQEFLLALKILQEGHVRLADMRSSWAGAMGLTQFLPSEFYKYAVDFDGDGRRDIWTSVPDALASAAKQLADKGWQPGRRWAYEVRAPANVDCTIAEPQVIKPIREWLEAGYVPAYGRRLERDELAEPASLLLPEGTYGPAFLTLKNYYVIKEYNFADLYVLFVGSLSDRFTDPRPFETRWAKLAPLRTAQVERMQRYLTEHGYYADKIDGKAGMKTRVALGKYQQKNGLKVDCWPTAAVVSQMLMRSAGD
jgi:lytic murein transglycosylase